MDATFESIFTFPQVTSTYEGVNRVLDIVNYHVFACVSTCRVLGSINIFLKLPSFSCTLWGVSWVHYHVQQAARLHPESSSALCQHPSSPADAIAIFPRTCGYTGLQGP